MLFFERLTPGPALFATCSEVPVLFPRIYSSCQAAKHFVDTGAKKKRGQSNEHGRTRTGATSIGSADLNKLHQSLDSSLRTRSAFYLNPATLDYLQGLIDKQGRPLVSYRKGYYGEDIDEQPTLLNRPVCLCPSMPTMASSANSVIFGCPDYFLTRWVRDSYFQRFMQAKNLVEYGLVAFASYMRVDSNILPSPTLPAFSVLQQHS